MSHEEDTSHSKPSFYAIIPADVRYCKALEPSAKLLYGEITALCNREGYCWASNKYFSELYDVDLTTIVRWILSLKEQNFIRVETTRKGFISQRKIFLGDGIQKSFTKVQKCTSGGAKMHVPEVQKCTTNNTSITTSLKDDDLSPVGALQILAAEMQAAPRDAKDFSGQLGCDQYVINHTDGTQSIVSAGDVYTMAVQKRKDWTQPEIRLALESIKTSCPLIRDLVPYIDSVIKNIRRENHIKTKGKKTCKKEVLKNESETIKPITLAPVIVAPACRKPIWTAPKEKPSEPTWKKNPLFASFVEQPDAEKPT